MKESELYYPIKDYFEKEGYTVYSEVIPMSGRSRADIVLKKDNELVVIEMKKNLSFDLIDQIRNWIPYSNKVFIAVPMNKNKRSQSALDILNVFGIGLIEIDIDLYQNLSFISKNSSTKYIQSHNSPETYGMVIKEGIAREMNETSRLMFSNLKEEHKEWTVGGSSNEKGATYVTEYSIFEKSILEIMKNEINKSNEGWITEEEIVSLLLKKYYSERPLNFNTADYLNKSNQIEKIKIKEKLFYKIILDEETSLYA